MKLRYTCSHCGSDNLTWDAAVTWDEHTQEYEICNVYDNPPTCQECGKEAWSNTQEVADELTPVQIAAFTSRPELGAISPPGEANYINYERIKTNLENNLVIGPLKFTESRAGSDSQTIKYIVVMAQNNAVIRVIELANQVTVRPYDSLIININHRYNPRSAL